MGRLRSTMGTGALLLFGVAASLGVLEVFLRVVNPLQSRLWGDRIVLQPNYSQTITNVRNPRLEPVIHFSRNSLGFRGPEPPRDFAGSLTILALGGSTTECWFLSDGKDWPAVLGRRLAERFDGVWVNNAGMEGHSTFGHLLLLEQWVVKLRPKVALFLLGINDVEREDLKAGDRALARGGPSSAWDALVGGAARRSAIVATLVNLGRSRRAERLNLTHGDVRLQRLPPLPLKPEYRRNTLLLHEQRYVPGYRERVLRLVAACRAGGIEPVLVTQPALYGEGVDDVTGVDLARVTVDNDPEHLLNGSLSWRILELYNDTLRAIGRERGAYVVDLARRLPKSSRYFYDFVHFTGEGAEAVGALVAQDLCPFLASRFAEKERAACPEAPATEARPIS
ncbi:MAG TPA: SGNH/GDSL hydrolase family protein [Vicinamibacteria bacterium]|nr:SGNH/GDSL hydrolase family protein [Vicinamibacteria bacterium]